jgi:filamentous hemagglutinin family protein
MRGTVLFTAVLLSTTAAFANPTGGTVSAGLASISSSGNTVSVTETSNKAVIDWQSFNIASGETTQFIQPSSSSIVLNRINSGSPSQIFGHLDANGNIIILNQSGVLFGVGSQVDVNGLIATTSDISNQSFMKKGPLKFNRPGKPTSAVVNEGAITAADAGLVGLVAPNVINSGTITAKLGAVHLASADTFTVDFYGDGLLNFGISNAVKSQLVANTGLISAAGGKIALTAAAGNNIVNSLIDVSGKLSAPAVGEKDGKIFIYAEGSNAVKGNVTVNKGQKSGSSTVLVDGYLDASGYSTGQTGGTISVLGDSIGIMSGALIDASGDAGGGTIKIGGDFHGEGTTPTALNTYIDPNSLIMANANTTGNGGNVTVWSDNTTQFLGNILAEGGKQSGNGGYVETSGHGTLDAEGYVDLIAPKGLMGTWLLDPTNITIDGGVTPAFDNSPGVTDGTQVSLGSSLALWLDSSNASSITLSYNSVTTTSAATSGNIITVSSAAGLVVGERVQIGTSTSELASVNDVSNVYTITAMSGTAVTLDANPGAVSSGATIYGGYVSQINDQSGNGYNATQSTVANMPLWISNGQNGLGVLSFNGNEDLVAYPTITSSATFSMLASSTGLPNPMLFALAPGAPGPDLFFYSGVISWNTYDSANNPFAAIPGSSTDGNFHEYLTTVAPGNTKLSYDGAFLGSANYASAASSEFQVGGQPPTYAWGGEISDTTIYNTALSTNAQALINQYQSAKWGIALTGPGVIGSEAGLTGSEAQQAMASVQAGAATDGYSVFTASYLTRLSQTSNIILQASNNINLDLQGNTLSLAAGKNITLTAGHQIVTDSTGEISTSQSSGTGGNITFNATNGIVFNNAFTLSSGGGNINLNNNITLAAGLTANAGSGTLAFGGTLNGGYDLTATAGTFSFNSALGGGAALADVSLTSSNPLTLPSISAATILAQTTGASSNLTIGSGAVLTASGSGDAVTLASGDNFINSEGSDALNLTGSGRWLIYSATPGADTFDSLNSSNTAIWDASYGGTITQAGDRYVFSYQPTLNFTSTSDSKTYGADGTAAVASDYSVGGLEAAVSNAYLADTNNTAFSGSPDVTSSGSATTATVAGGPYTIDITAGTIAALDGYALGSYTSSGSLTVNAAPLTITASNESKSYGASYSPSSTAFITSGLLNSDSVTSTTLNSSGAAATATVTGGPYNIVPSAAIGSGLSNYTITYGNGLLTVNTASLSITADNEAKIYGAVYNLGTTAFTTSGLLNSDSVNDVTLSSTGAASTASATGGPYAIVPSAASGTGLSNYMITYNNGALTVNPAPVTTLPSTVIVVSQNVPTYISAGIASDNPIAIANNTTVISNAPQQTSDQSGGSPGQSKPQGMNTSYSGNIANGIPSNLSLFGGILTIDPEVVSKFKLGYLKDKW